MKQWTLLLFVLAVLIGLGSNAYAIPSGAEFLVDEETDPLVLDFSGLPGSLTFDYFIETDFISGAWDVTIFKDDLNNPSELGRIYLTATSTDWQSETLTDGSLLSGDVRLFILLDDYGATNNVAMYFKNFSSTPTYVKGGAIASVPEPSTIVLIGFGLVGLAGISRKKLKK